MRKSLYEAAFAAIPDGITIQDTNFKILYQNDAHKRIYGDQAGKLCYRAYQNRQKICEGCLLSATLESGKAHSWQTETKTGDGLFFGEITTAPLRDENGRITAIAEVTRDITKYCKAEKDLSAAKQQADAERAKFEAIISSIGDAISIQDKDFRILYQNKAAIDMAGGHIGEYCYQAYEHNANVCESCQLELTFEDGKAHSMQREASTEGGLRYLEITASPLKDPAGRTIAAIEVVRDLTKRRKSEEAFRKTAATLKYLVEASPLAIITLTLDGVVTSWNPAAERIFGWKENEVTGSIYPLVPEDKKGEFESHLNKIRNGESITGIRVKRRRKDGSLIDLNLAVSPVRDENSKLAGMLALLEDITDRVKMEEQIFQAQHDWEDTFNQLTEMITIQDTDCNILRANKAAQKILGLSGPGKSRGKCHEYYHGKDCPPDGCPSLATMKTMLPATSELYEPRLNMFLEISTIPRFDANKQLTGIIHVVKDITDRKCSEAKIKSQLEKMRALRKIDTAIAGSLDLQTILDIFLDEVLSKLNADAADVLLLNPHMMCLEYAASKGFLTESIRHIRLKAGDSCAGQVVLKRKNFIFPNISEAKCEYLTSREHQFPQTYLVSKEGFKAYFGAPLIVKGQVRGVLEIFHRSTLKPDEEWLEFLDSLAKQGAVAIDNSLVFEELQKSHNELTMAYDTTIEGWSKALDYRDAETEGHSQRVTEVALKIAEAFGIKDSDLVHIRRGALLHDIGKLGVPDRILLKNGPLSEEEWKIMKKHPEIAFDLLSPIEYLEPAIVIPYYHHERWDGTGYPIGLKGKQIPLPARIFAVADVWDALCSDRPYRKAWPKEMVIEHLRSLSGKHFDPLIVDAFLNILHLKSSS